MHLKFFSVPALDVNSHQDLERFLQQHRIIGIEKHFVSSGVESFWSVCVSYVSQGPLISNTPSKNMKDQDIRDQLSSPDFALYCKLKNERKMLADAQGIALYNIFNNEQLAHMAEHKPKTVKEFSQIDGVGKSRTEKYATSFLDIIRSHVEMDNTKH